MERRNRYLGRFGEAGAGLSEADWIIQADTCLPPNLSALNARFVDGSRSEQSLRVVYEPGPAAFTYIGLSGGSIAEMLDQAATHCGTFVTSHPCPTLAMTVNYLRAGTGSLFVATARVLRVTAVSALLGADLADAEGWHIASVSVVSQLIKNLSRYK